MTSTETPVIESATRFRAGTLDQAHAYLKELRARQVDVVVGRDQIEARQGRLIVKTNTPRGDLTVIPTPHMESQMATELGISLKHLRAVRARSLSAVNVGLDPEVDESTALRGDAAWRYMMADAFHVGRRAHMLRLYSNQADIFDGRCLLSPSYGRFDNLNCTDVAMRALMAAGLNVDTTDVRMDLTDRRMVLKVNVPQINVLAREWLKGYRNPLSPSHSGYQAGEEPIVEAGIIITNGETGGAGLAMGPYFRVKICKNGLTVPVELAKWTRDHKGSRMDVGELAAAEDTAEAFSQWVTLTMRDNIRRWLSPEYMNETILQWEVKSVRRIETDTAPDFFRELGRSLIWTEDESDQILQMWNRGGQFTTGGVMHAVTAYTQTIPNADRAWELELSAEGALNRAYALAR